MLQFLLQEGYKIVLPLLAAGFTAVTWLFPGFPRLVRKWLRIRMKAQQAWRALVGAVVLAFVGISVMCFAFAYSQFKTANKSKETDDKKRISNIATNLGKFGLLWAADNNMWSARYRDRYENEFMKPVQESFRTLVEHGYWSSNFQSGYVGDASQAISNAGELQRLLKQWENEP